MYDTWQIITKLKTLDSNHFLIVVILLLDVTRIYIAFLKAFLTTSYGSNVFGGLWAWWKFFMLHLTSSSFTLQFESSLILVDVIPPSFFSKVNKQPWIIFNLLMMSLSSKFDIQVSFHLDDITCLGAFIFTTIELILFSTDVTISRSNSLLKMELSFLS